MNDTVALSLNFMVDFPRKQYKGFLNKIQQFLRYSATVGIHSNDGKRRVTRKYINSSGKSKIAGKTSTMTLAKLVYQNEYGAIIPIKPRYKDSKRSIDTVYHTFKQRIRIRTIEHYSALRGAKEQGFLLISKTGKFVMYKKPGSVIKIPARPFLRPIIEQPQPQMLNDITNIMSSMLQKGGLSAKSAIKTIAKLVENRIKWNIHNQNIPNHPTTKKAKGFNSPLTDEQDRIYKAVKTKIYKDKDILSMQPITMLEKLKKSADQYTNKGVFKTEQTTKVFTYKKFNPNFMK